MSTRIGQSIDRLEGPAKVTGQAQYAADTRMPGLIYAMIVPATVPHGRIARIETSVAASAPGVIRIFTHENTPKLHPLPSPPAGQIVMPLQDDRVLHEGQAVALVLADTLERVTEAARLVEVTYETAPFETDFLKRIEHGEARPAFGWPPDTSIGDFAAAWAAAPTRIEHVYRTADRHHNPMEPSATIAVWQGGELTLHDTTQAVVATRDGIAQALGLDAAKVRVRNDYIGGGFGCKGWIWPHQVLAAMAARELGRPVKLVLTRALSFTSHGYQAASQQTVALSARGDGKLTGMRHDSVLAGSYTGQHYELAGAGTRSLYASPAIRTTHRAVRVHRNEPTPMRAPLEGVGLVALEIAMDELAYELGLDPVALRLTNYAEVDPSDGKPFSSKKLRECYEEGARRFGWSRRSAAPRSMREGRDLVGWGMATAIFGAFRNPAKARLSLDRSGAVLIETSTQEMGTGARTVFPQIAADILGVPVERVGIAWGDTRLPPAPMQGGSTSTLSVGSAVQDGAQMLKRKLAEAGAATPADYARTVAELGVDRVSVIGEYAPSQDASAALYSFGAVFAEVRIDEDLPLPRVSRVTGVYNAGKIINPKTARSQMIGGITWGIGQALLERSEMDHRLGRFLSKNLAGYLVPVNADVPEIDASFVEDFDAIAGPIGARGIGELGAIGVGAAIANAVFHATGVRIREVPIRPEMLLA
jgi:xanthine dehydrogenase YagR molybdenum-binding subunit